MAGVVALGSGNSQGSQIIDPGPRSVGITTSYGDSPVPGNQSQGAHPRPGYAHEMDGSGIPGSKQGHLWAANIANLLNLQKLYDLGEDGSGGVRVTPFSGRLTEFGEALLVVSQAADGLGKRVGR
jgi:hypothetical protein